MPSHPLAAEPGREHLTLTHRPERPPAGDTGEPAYLLVIEEGTSRIHPLPSMGEVTIGRAADAHVRLADAAASRLHARLRLSGDEAVLTDAGSHNGTRVNGEPVVGGHRLCAGDVIQVCSTQLVFHRSARTSVTRKVLGFEALCLRLEEEVERAQQGEHPLLVACARYPEESAVDRPRVGEALAGRLRLMDAAAWCGASELLVLLPGREEAEAGAVLEALAHSASSVQVGLARCPADGCDADTLLGVAREAARRARSGLPTAGIDGGATRQIAGRTVVLADPAMIRLFALADTLAPTQLPVLVGGETGTGKELVAWTLHHGSRSKDGPFVTLNCAALPEALAESELFGHARGAFSGAVSAKVGLLEAASGGTLFLDEIGELPLSLQAKLLRVLETQRLTRLGEVKERSLDFRLVAATHRVLEDEVKAGRFRQDLLFRLGLARVVLPPLRDRRRELPVLARVLLEEACARMEGEPLTLSPAAVQCLLLHRWPGNVRELRNLLAYVAATVRERVVQPWHLEALLSPGAVPTLDAETDALRAGMTMPPGDPAQGETFRPLEEELRELEATRMLQAMEAASWVKKRAAALLSMPLRTFVGKYKLYGLPSQPGRADEG